ncbi:MAG: phospholipid methyltransferase [Planctomycetes bacterium]|nr:phospholipid methyltransferase [Planctomycetota bacterium]
MRSTLAFFGQMASRWRETGAIAPSGPVLAKAMVRTVGPVAPGQIIVELGPGTGSFTKELIRRYPANRVVAIEFNPIFVNNLRRDMPAALVIEGCASQLPRLLHQAGIDCRQVGAVVSGLPLLVLPEELSAGILHAVAEILPHGRPFVQFTYSKKRWERFSPRGFQAHPSRRVWLNFPPAVILPFTRAC